MALKRFFRRSRWDDERARELEAHLAIETDDNIARGMSPRDARDAARRKLGNTALDPRGDLPHEHDRLPRQPHGAISATARACSGSIPASPLVAILSLALGVGANTAIFQLLDAVRLRTLPVARTAGAGGDPHRRYDRRTHRPVHAAAART